MQLPQLLTEATVSPAWIPATRLPGLCAPLRPSVPHPHWSTQNIPAGGVLCSQAEHGCPLLKTLHHSPSHLDKRLVLKASPKYQQVHPSCLVSTLSHSNHVFYCDSSVSPFSPYTSCYSPTTLGTPPPLGASYW